MAISCIAGGGTSAPVPGIAESAADMVAEDSALVFGQLRLLGQNGLHDQAFDGALAGCQAIETGGDGGTVRLSGSDQLGETAGLVGLLVAQWLELLLQVLRQLDHSWGSLAVSREAWRQL